MMNTQQNTEQEIKFWTMMKSKYNNTYNEWCPQSFKDQLEEDVTNFKNKSDKVINELNNLDKKHYCYKHFNRGMRIRQFKTIEMLLRRHLRPDVTHKNVFGILDINKDDINFRFNNKVGQVRLSNIKNGIEILNMRIGKNNQTQKYNYGRYEEVEENEIVRHTIKELKTFCKMNGIKGNSKFDKVTAVKALMEL